MFSSFSAELQISSFVAFFGLMEDVAALYFQVWKAYPFHIWSRRDDWQDVVAALQEREVISRSFIFYSYSIHFVKIPSTFMYAFSPDHISTFSQYSSLNIPIPFRFCKIHILKKQIKTTDCLVHKIWAEKCGLWAKSTRYRDFVLCTR